MHRGRGYKTIFAQISLFAILVSVLPITVFSLYMYHKSDEWMTQELIYSYEQIAEQYTGKVQEKLAQCRKSMLLIANNTMIQEELLDDKKSVYERGNRISNEVFKSLYLDEQNKIGNCMVYSAEKDKIVYGSKVSMMGAADKEYWYRQYDGKEGEWFYYSHPVEKYGNVAALVYDIKYQDLHSLHQENIGLVKLEIYMDKLFSYSDEEGRNFEILVFDETGRIWYGTDVALETEFQRLFKEGKYSERLEDASQDGRMFTADGQMTVLTRLEDCGLNVLLLFDHEKIKEKRGEMARTLIPILAMVVGILSSGCYLFTKRFSHRVNLLVAKFKRVEDGDLTITPPIYGNDEINVLDEQFSHMLKRLNRLIQKNYVQELDKREIQLQNLQMQINPHFLYNTLETISSMAAVRQAFTVCDMCGKLGEIFRYSLGKDYGEFVTVEQELHHVQNYIFIQKVRYRDKFEVFINVEGELKQCKILRFVLQPMVENAILHGIVPMTGSGTIEITVEKKDEALCVRVEDDGVGMDSMQREQLIEYINRDAAKEEKTKSIGVKNVHQRIRLACGEEYGVQVESVLYSGSSFVMTFPFKR